MVEDYGLVNDRAPHVIADLCEIVCYFEDREVSRGDIETILAEAAGDSFADDLGIHGLDSAESNAKYQALSEEVVRHLSYRAKAFGAYYPFVVEADILVPESPATQNHQIYAALLAFSRLKMFKKTDQVRFANDFEVLCVEAAAGLARSWTVIHFASGGRDRAKFGNRLKDALRNLARELRRDSRS